MTGLILLDSFSKDPLYMQLYRHFKSEIEQNKCNAGDKLPSIRWLANNLSVSKITVEKAYQQLVSEGYISSRSRSRYVVNKLEEAAIRPYTALVSKEYEPFGQRNVRYDFASGEMDPDGFDFSLWKRYINKAFLDKNRLMGYGNSKGEEELRREIVNYIRSRGVYCHREQIVVGPGVQNLLNILCSILQVEHNSIAFEEPGFTNGRRVWADWGFTIVPVRMRQDGIDTDELIRSGVKLVYLTPSHQFPTGYVMPIGKRTRLLKWAQQTGAVIIEDDYDSEFRYFGRPIPALKGLDNEGSVVYLGSFSKVIPPSIRLSYMVLPDQLRERYEQNSPLYNQAVSTIEQLALAQYMADGQLERQIRRLRKLYCEKQLLFMETIKRIFGSRADVKGTGSGLHIVLTVKSALSPREMFLKAMEQGCRIAPIQNYYVAAVPENLPQVILYFSKIPSGEMETAIKLLKDAWF
ncbi:MAG: PLP-dependent aminotransferase family protein [Veillonellales bacterium]